MIKVCVQTSSLLQQDRNKQNKKKPSDSDAINLKCPQKCAVVICGESTGKKNKKKNKLVGQSKPILFKYGLNHEKLIKAWQFPFSYVLVVHLWIN